MSITLHGRSGAGLLLFLVAACAGGAGMGSGSGLRANVGTFEAQPILEESRDFFRRIAWDVETENGPPAILIQTFWRSQLPTEAEADAGVVDARTRFRILGRQRQGMTETTELYVTTVTVEHQVRLDADGPWVEMAATGDYLAWARDTVRQLRLQMESARGRES